MFEILTWVIYNEISLSQHGTACTVCSHGWRSWCETFDPVFYRVDGAHELVDFDSSSFFVFSPFTQGPRRQGVHANFCVCNPEREQT